MSEERDFLHQSDDLSIELIVNDGAGSATFVISSDGSAFDLTAADEVVVVFEGTGLQLVVESPGRATASIELEKLDSGGTLMIRIHEYLDGWEF